MLLYAFMQIPSGMGWLVMIVVELLTILNGQPSLLSYFINVLLIISPGAVNFQ